MMKSKITGGSTTKIFTAKVLQKYDVSYYRCDETGFIQTEEPYWLAESYAEAITSLDLGLVDRNLVFRDSTTAVIDGWFDRKGRFVDFGGGYGLFVRLMRDIGYDFYRSDRYCDNLFAKSFDWDEQCGEYAELLTAWEVFEHLPDPNETVAEILGFADSILFSTMLIPKNVINSPDSWWYFLPEIGQHVSFYNIESLEFLANRHGLNFHTNGSSLHILTRRSIPNPFRGRLAWLRRSNWWKMRRLLLGRFLGRWESLLQSDFERLRAQLNSSSSHNS